MNARSAFLLAVLLFLPAQVRAAEQIVEEKTHFSVTVPGGWAYYSDAAKNNTPEHVLKAFDATDVKKPELYMVGWKGNTGRFQGAFAVTYVHRGMLPFLSKVLGSDQKAKAEAAAGFSSLEAIKIRKAYEARGQKVVESSMDFLEADNMFVAVSDAIIDAGGTRRLRSATYYFRGDSMIGVITLRDEKAPADIAGALENLPTSVIWND